MKPLIIPTVNLNGNTAADLVRQLTNVMHALRAAEEALATNADVTHGRNFLPSALDGERKDSHAREAWRERRRALEKMHDEIMQMALNVQAQGEGRR